MLQINHATCPAAETGCIATALCMLLSCNALYMAQTNHTWCNDKEGHEGGTANMLHADPKWAQVLLVALLYIAPPGTT